MAEKRNTIAGLSEIDLREDNTLADVFSWIDTLDEASLEADDDVESDGDSGAASASPASDGFSENPSEAPAASFAEGTAASDNGSGVFSIAATFNTGAATPAPETGIIVPVTLQNTAPADNVSVTVALPQAPEGNPEDHVSACCCPACLNPREETDETDGNTYNGDPSADGTSAAGSVATLDEMADFLRVGYWGNGVGARHNLGTSGLDPNDGVLYYNVSGTNGALPYSGGLDDADGISAARAELVRDAFDVYESVLGIDFVETTDTNADVVDFFFIDNEGGAFASSPRWSDGTIYASYINVAASWSGGTSTYDDYTLQTIFHEIGHALGLGHQGSYNGSASYGTDALYENDSWQASMMSYFSQSENTNINANYEFLQTPMAVDWLALDDIYSSFGYGVENAFTGDTIYGFNTNISADTSRIWNEYSDYADRTASTIIDAGGVDTIDFSGYSANQRIDLTVQTGTQTDQNASDIGGRVGNLTLAVGTVIENAVGGSGNDALIGNEADNVLSGGAGDDWFVGKAGDDTFYGHAGFDTVFYDIDFGEFTFSLLDDAIEVIGDGVDLVYDTIENFEFSDAVYSFMEIYDLFDNAAPVAEGDSATVAEGAALTLDVLANDTDADEDTLSITQIEGQSVEAGDTVTLESGAIVTLNANGTLDYDQNSAFDALYDGDSTTDEFAYTVSDGNGGEDTGAVSVTVEGVGEPALTAIGESGVAAVAQAGPDQWHSVSFSTIIEDAVVVMGPATGNDDDPLTTRVRNVTETGFEFQIDEWDYLDGTHDLENIGWLAVSEGTHEMESGRTIVASNAQVGTSFTSVSFGETLTDAVVLAETGSVNDADAVATRIRRVDENGFQIQLEEQELSSAHGAETVGWIAIESAGDDALQVFRTPDNVRHVTARYDFEEAYANAPVLLADMQSTDGGDSATVRLDGLDGEGVSLFIEEEQSLNEEVRHTTETVGVVALNDGILYAENISNSDPDAVDDTATAAEGFALTIDVLANDGDADNNSLSITEIEGQAIASGGTVTLASGASVTLNADGTLNYGQNGVFDALGDGENGSDAFTYTVSDGQGGTDTATVDVTVEGTDREVIGQSGTVTVFQDGSEEWHSVTFDAAISDAVVVMGPISYNGHHQATIRIRDVTDTGFEFQVDEWDYLDGRHTTESIGWMAMSEGTHTLSTGQTVVASTAEVGTDFTSVSFGETLNDAVVLADVSSVNEADAVTTRIRNVDDAGFEVTLQEEEAGGAHADETVSWIAIESGTGEGLDVMRTADQLSHTVDRFDFRTDFDTAPVLLADMQSRDGGDTATVRMQSLDATGTSLFVEEERSANDELRHTNETAGYVALNEGLIYEDTFLF